jgi:thiaminase
MDSFASSLSKEELLKDSPKQKFIESMNSGKVTKEELNKWLIDDFRFTLVYVNFMEHVHDLAPDSDKPFWDNAVGLVEDEVTWYDKVLKEIGISIENVKQQAASPTSDHWLYYLMETKKSYLAFVLAVYALELSNYEAWKASKTADCRRFANRWGTRGTKKFVDEVAAKVDQVSKTASEADQNEAREVWNTVLKLEVDYKNKEPGTDDLDKTTATDALHKTRATDVLDKTPATDGLDKASAIDSLDKKLEAASI